jgi:mannan endo-1,4-beta-mannosidase
MKKIISAVFLLIIIGTSCSTLFSSYDTKSSISDKKSTHETIILFENLKKLAQTNILFGHQDDLAYGVNWRYEAGRSDVKEVTGDYPAVYGWDLAGLEINAKNNIDGVPFDKMKEYIKEAHNRGGVITLSWHMNNPLTGGNAWDTTPKSLASALPGGVSHELFKSWLDQSVPFFLSLKDKKGKAIPVLYRPFHELTGNWFWWCKNNGSPQEFKTLWTFTIEYLKSKGVHNLIYIYNTADFNSKEDFLEYYPGSEYVDVLSFDKYQYKDDINNSFIANCQKQFKIMNEVATEQNKMMAFAETGFEEVPDANWWTNTLMKAIGDYKISYVLVWRNHGWNEAVTPAHMHYYAPYKGQKSENDFINFYNMEHILFEKEAANQKLYKQ